MTQWWVNFFRFFFVFESVGPSLTEMTYLGIVGICDPPRPMVREAINILTESGVQVKMVTGDAMETAVAIGNAHTRCFIVGCLNSNKQKMTFI